MLILCEVLRVQWQQHVTEVFPFRFSEFAAVSAVGALNEVWYHSVDTEESQVLRYHPVFKTSAGTASVMTNTFSVTNIWPDDIYESYGRRVTAFYQVGTVVVVSEHVTHSAHLSIDIYPAIHVMGVCLPSQSASEKNKKKEKPRNLCAPREFLKQVCVGHV